MLLMISDELH
uniref:Uncharacterized protein n=1 Tax=Arundo donax TaxID=35708 RepID=A0A0A9BTR2_ARUDO